MESIVRRYFDIFPNLKGGFENSVLISKVVAESRSHHGRGKLIELPFTHSSATIAF